jgi:hypothetical protein
VQFYTTLLTKMTKRGFTTPHEKEIYLEESRQRFYEESKQTSENKSRYGLFSYTGSLCIADNSLSRKVIPERDTDGRVATGPRNFYTSPGKKGTVKGYFSAPMFHSIGDPYNDPLRGGN